MILVANLDNMVFLGRAADFIEEYGHDSDDGLFLRELLVDVVRHPAFRPERDPTSDDAGYPFIRYRRGDITVIVGFKDPQSPAITYVYFNTPVQERSRGSQKPGAGGSRLPRSEKQLKGWLKSEGCTLGMRGSGHVGVYWHEILLGTVCSTPSDYRAIQNDFHFIRGRLNAERAKEEKRLAPERRREALRRLREEGLHS